MTSPTDELLAIYLEDARAHLESLDQALLTLEREGPAAEAAWSALGPLHTLKGNSGMMGFSSIKQYVHAVEEVIGRIRDGALRPTSADFDRLFAGATALRDAVERAGHDGVEARDLASEQASLEEMLSAGPAPSSSPPPAAPPPARVEAAASPAPAAPGPPARLLARSSLIRVDFARLDRLMDLVGELIIHRTRLEQVARDLARLPGARAAGRDLVEAARQVAAVSGELQQAVMDIRMLPLRHVFERFPRLVRDLAHEQGKDIELVIEGEETRVDKAIIDEIGEALVHMIRNSVDHGIEPPATRIARGKTPTGTIMLAASQESSHIVVTLTDDGAGIDAERVRRRAVDRGLLKADDELPERDLVQLVFSPGFSTSEAITDLSGRGVGLDVVVKSIERLNGLVEVETVVGVGTRFTIQLPLTLAIIPALLFEVAGYAYAVPLASVIESVRLKDVELHRLHATETLRLRDRMVPMLRLRALLGFAGAPGESAYAVVLGRGERHLALAVDRLRGEQDVVIKALDPAAAGEVPLAGATILGDGRLVLVLDVAALFEGRRSERLLAGASR
ncbi:MAG TPA: chemotaxis protein CheA [Vicinamibacteria bacterium]|nr:chemotaxis protein CheA [Vicinamibacteria bacterium]